MLRLLVTALVLWLAPVVTVPPRQAEATQGRLFGTVVSVANAGTLQVQITAGPLVTVRLIGVDAPDPRALAQPAQCFESEASARAAELVSVGDVVGLERDIQDADQYGRIPAYVWSVAGGSMVNEQLLAEGYVHLRAESVNVRHASRLAQAQQLAQANGLGLWSACVSGAQDAPGAQVAQCNGEQP